MSSPAPVTQRDVARVCGVHPSTICLALKNSPSIPPATRVRVQKVAGELGYRLNVAARNLAMLRSDRPAGGSLPIAWINQESARGRWRCDREARGHFESARRRAEELGYHLEEIWACEPGMTAGRLVQIVRARGIEGVIFPVHRRLDFSLLTPAWNDFAIVGLNDYRLAELLDVVCPDHARNLAVIWRRARQLGLGRIGLVLSPELDAASDGLLHGCFLRMLASNVPSEVQIPVCLLPEQQQERLAVLRAWLSLNAPQVVLSAETALVAEVRREAENILWLGLASAIDPYDGGLAAAESQAGALAVDCVVEKMRRFEKGLHELSRVHLVRSTWVEPASTLLETASVVA